MKISPHNLLMKSVLRASFFGFSIRFDEKTPAPAADRLAPDNIIVKVSAAGINPIDYKSPRIFAGKGVGIDFSGTITSIGSKVADLSVGDEVFGAAVFDGGSLAEYAAIKAANVARKPAWLSHTDAAALPVAHLTALQGLRDHGKLQQGGSVLIIGASGGTGLAACQLAKAIGASRIAGICSNKNSALIQEQGATEHIDYRDSKGLQAFFESNKSKFDVVLDCATSSGKGEDYTQDSLPLLTESGQYVQLNAPPMKWAKVLMFHRELGPKQHLFLASLNREDLEEVVSLLHNVNMTPVVTTMPFNDEAVRKGYENLQSRRVRGKIVFDIAESSE